MEAFGFGEDWLSIQTLDKMISGRLGCKIPESSKDRVNRYREIVDKSLVSGMTSYGINTGFGYLSDVVIDAEHLGQLQVNLIRSHACGTGSYCSPEISKGLLLLRIHTFCLGYTGISLQCVEMLRQFVERDIFPAVPEKGSVGASGDLAPLAHLAEPLLGEGRVYHKGCIKDSSEALKLVGLPTYSLKPKEGLSLINGTHFMTVIAAKAVSEASLLSRIADVISAISLDAIRGTLTAFDSRIQSVRPHKGQSIAASNIRKFLSPDDEIRNSHTGCEKVQDPYSFRCVPQVHGATRDAISFVSDKVEIELNSVTDNPLCFALGEVVSGGNFHGQPIALSMDLLAIAVAELGSIAERRIEKLTNPSMSGLPAFIVDNSGLNSGYMIPHVVAASLVSENKVLCHPASVDSIPTSADKEDHVSMGPISARKARTIIENVFDILAIEMLAACQGLDLLKPLKPGKFVYSVYQDIRELSPHMKNDRSMYDDIKKVSSYLKSGKLISTLENQGLVLE